ncbi:MAG: hypothetical protein GXO32_01365 [Crenarchaeota archaeon]|nr:hypothetical protein [Thermoproteota archaeon]
MEKESYLSNAPTPQRPKGSSIASEASKPIATLVLQHLEQPPIPLASEKGSCPYL